MLHSDSAFNIDICCAAQLFIKWKNLWQETEKVGISLSWKQDEHSNSLNGS